MSSVGLEGVYKVMVSNAIDAMKQTIQAKDDGMKKMEEIIEAKDDRMKEMKQTIQAIIEAKEEAFGNERKLLIVLLSQANIQILKLQGALGLRGVIEQYELSKSSKKAMNPKLSRMAVWSDILSDPTRRDQFLKCMSTTAQNPESVASVMCNMYASLSNEIHHPYTITNVIKVESQRFTKEELCLFRTLLQDFVVPFEVYNSKKEVEEVWPDGN